MPLIRQIRGLKNYLDFAKKALEMVHKKEEKAV
jgi:hypothetical protein